MCWLRFLPEQRGEKLASHTRNCRAKWSSNGNCCRSFLCERIRSLLFLEINKKRIENGHELEPLRSVFGWVHVTVPVVLQTSWLCCGQLRVWFGTNVSKWNRDLPVPNNLTSNHPRLDILRLLWVGDPEELRQTHHKVQLVLITAALFAECLVSDRAVIGRLVSQKTQFHTVLSKDDRFTPECEHLHTPGGDVKFSLSFAWRSEDKATH